MAQRRELFRRTSEPFPWVVPDGLRVFPVLCFVRERPLHNGHESARLLGQAAIRVYVDYHCSHCKPARRRRTDPYCDGSCRPPLAGARYSFGRCIGQSLHGSAVLASRSVQYRKGTPPLRSAFALDNSTPPSPRARAVKASTLPRPCAHQDGVRARPHLNRSTSTCGLIK